MDNPTFIQRDETAESYRRDRISYWNTVACQMDTWEGWGGYYHKRLTEIYQFLVPPGQRVIEIGCGRGDLLAALRPAVGVGVDFSNEMTTRAAITTRTFMIIRFSNRPATVSTCGCSRLVTLCLSLTSHTTAIRGPWRAGRSLRRGLIVINLTIKNLPTDRQSAHRFLFSK